jgi:hypothetical protein
MLVRIFFLETQLPSIKSLKKIKLYASRSKKSNYQKPHQQTSKDTPKDAIVDAQVARRNTVNAFSWV